MFRWFYHTQIWWWFQVLFYFHPNLGIWSDLTNIFQMCWNHQLARLDGVLFRSLLFWTRTALLLDRSKSSVTIRKWWMMKMKLCKCIKGTVRKKYIICIYIHMNVIICKCAFMYICLSTGVCMYICMYMCVWLYVYMWKCFSFYVYMFICPIVFVCLCLYVYICLYMSLCLCENIYIYVQAYMFQVLGPPPCV